MVQIKQKNFYLTIVNEILLNPNVNVTQINIFKKLSLVKTKRFNNLNN